MLASKDFYKKCNYNGTTKEQMWCSATSDFHDSFCGCQFPIAHFLAAIFPPGHQDRNKTIEYILKRDYKELCLSGGTAAESHGLAEGFLIKEEGGLEEDKENHIPEGDTADDLLMAAVAAAEEER